MHPTLTRDFLTSFELNTNSSREDFPSGFVRFRLRRRLYTLSPAEFDGLLGFSSEGDSCIEMGWETVQRRPFWATITSRVI